jgi:hypothetical protein
MSAGGSLTLVPLVRLNACAVRRVAVGERLRGLRAAFAHRGDHVTEADAELWAE